MNYKFLSYTAAKKVGQFGLVVVKVHGIAKSLGVKMPHGVSKSDPSWKKIIEDSVKSYIKEYLKKPKAKK